VGGLWEVTGRDDRKGTRDGTHSLFPASWRGGVNHRWKYEREGLAPEALAYVTVLQTSSVGGRCDAILASGHRNRGLTSAISQSSEPIPDMLKRHWCAWQTSGRGRAEGVPVYIFSDHL